MNINSQAFHRGVKRRQKQYSLAIGSEWTSPFGEWWAELKISIYERICVMGG